MYGPKVLFSMQEKVIVHYHMHVFYEVAMQLR